MKNRLRRIAETDLSDHVLLDTIVPVLREAADDHGVAVFLSRVRGNVVEIIHVEDPDTGVCSSIWFLKASTPRLLVLESRGSVLARGGRDRGRVE